MMITGDNYFMTEDGARIYFEDYGKGEAILIIPGFLCTTKFFRKNIEGLSKDHRLILVDVRGHGNSTKPLNNLTIPGLAQDIKGLVDYLGLENLNLFSWSLGSSISLSYYEQFGPHRLKRLGIIDSALYPFSTHPSNSHPLKGFDIDGMNSVIVKMQKDHEAYCRNFARILFRNTPPPEDEEWVAREAMKCPPYIAYAIYTDFLFRDYVRVLPSVNIPLFLGCANSPIVPQGVEMAKHYLEFIKTTCKFTIFENEGHVMFYENPEKFNSEILDFIQHY
jgi:pimeloyl-ACP methyl ester carboxylesterase